MKKVIKTAAWLALALAAAMVVAVQTATVVRQVKKPAELKPDGVTERTRTDDALDYSVAIDIAAPAPIVWALLTNASAYPQWNTSITKIEGTIGKTEELRFTAKSRPDVTLTARVSELQKNEQLVWEMGGKSFKSVRRFTLLPSTDGTHTTFAMSETFSGRFLPIAERSLPDLSADFSAFAKDLKAAAEKVAPPG